MCMVQVSKLSSLSCNDVTIMITSYEILTTETSDDYITYVAMVGIKKIS